MTYRELLYKATSLCSRDEITIDEYMEMTKPLNREVEQEPCEDAVSRKNVWSMITGGKYPTPVTPIKWIPVSERTPEHGGEYLLWGKICDDDDEEYCFLGDYYEFEEKFGIEKSNYDPHTLGFLDTEIDEYYSVKAWMPLPKPYKESEEV